jgi:hypothetical protein
MKVPTPVATPTPAALDQQAAKLREQAAGLNRRQADREEATGADYGTRLDDAHRTATTARSASAAATTQADELHDKAKESLGIAQRFEEEAARMAADGSPGGREGADDLREQAQLLRAGASSYTQRAQRSEQVARQQLDDAERADRQAFQIENGRGDQSSSLDNMRHTANQLEDKATELEQAASELRQADRAFTSEERATFLGQAQATLTRADAITPDFSRIATDDIVGAGIPVSAVPGNELMDPRSLLDPVDPGIAPPVDLHDTDLMDPNGPDPVNPGVAPVPPVDVHDTDLMDPNAPDPVNPGPVDVHDTDLMDPDASSGLDVDGDGLPDVTYYDPAQPNVVDESVWDVDDDGRADPFDGAGPDPGDFGLTTVEAPAAPATAPVPSPVTASLGQDAYMDQPDVGSTSSYGGDPYGDAYGDSGGSNDETSVEYGA